MSLEQPQTSPSIDELLETARIEADAGKSPEAAGEATKNVAPSSMEDLLKGLQEEIEIKDVPPTVVSTAEVQQKPVENDAVEAKIEDPVKTELEQKYAELGDKYSEGHKKFGDKWTSTPEFQALGRESSLFRDEYKSKGFTLENGVIKPIDKEKLERERQIKELDDAAGKLIVKSDIETGKGAYAVLSGNIDLYKKSVEDELQAAIERQEISLKNEELVVAGDLHTNDSIRTPKEKENYLEYRRNETARIIESFRERIAELNDPKRVEELMKNAREGLSNRSGLWKKGQRGSGFAMAGDGKRIDSSTDLIRVLKDKFAERFDLQKQYHVLPEHFFGAFSMVADKAHALKGVGLAALENGDIKTATESLAFSELINPMSPEEMQEMISAISKLTPEQKREFVTGMDAEKKKPHRDYKKEVETGSKDPIVSR